MGGSNNPVCHVLESFYSNTVFLGVRVCVCVYGCLNTGLMFLGAKDAEKWHPLCLQCRVLCLCYKHTIIYEMFKHFLAIEPIFFL